MGYLDNIIDYEGIVNLKANYKTIYAFNKPTIPIKININDGGEVGKLEITRYFEIIKNKPIEIKIFESGSVAEQKLKKHEHEEIINTKEEYNYILKRYCQACKFMHDDSISEAKKENYKKKFDEVEHAYSCIYTKARYYNLIESGREPYFLNEYDKPNYINEVKP